MPINAICGPDGAGKTTLASNAVKALGKHNEAIYMYGGKKSGHYLPTTTITHALLKFIRRIPVIRKFSRVYQAIIFYPFEYLEYWARYLVARYKSRRGATIFIDRFVVDRMWRSKINLKDNGHIKYRIEDKIYGKIYERLFPSIDAYIFLLPDAATIYQRASAEYNSFEHCIAMRSAYQNLANHLKERGENIYIIDEVSKPEILVSKLIDQLNS